MVDSLFTARDGHCCDAKSTTEKSVSDLEETCGRFWDIANKLSIFGHIVERIEHGSAWNLDMIEHQTSIIDTIQANLHAHVFDHDTLGRFHLVISDLDNEAVDSLVLSIDDGLRKHDRIIGMTGSICDPEFLR